MHGLSFALRTVTCILIEQDLVKRLHIQIRLMGNFGFNGDVPWLSGTDGAQCFICKQNVESVTHFLLDCPNFRENVDFIWNKLKYKITNLNPIVVVEWPNSKNALFEELSIPIVHTATLYVVGKLMCLVYDFV